MLAYRFQLPHISKTLVYLWSFGAKSYYKIITKIFLMKPTLLLFSLFLLGLAACKKEDKCETIICQNGGTCDDGTCICINGFSGQFCQTAPDPCAGITCLNGGVCANGVCNCPPGYSGSDCGTQLTPSKIKIYAAFVTNFPITTSSGSSWDLTNGADIYLQLYYGSTLIADNLSQQVVNATTVPVEWNNLPNDFVIDEPNDQYRLILKDRDDFDADDLVGELYFSPYNAGSGFPANLQLSDAFGDFTVSIWLEYEF